ncbi:hypothetical protein PDE_04601 [Penicillium oxalicum 114-2]|uniref:Uncharacterized protein n=1 Tax=Penicillium oxalicum (strain 114-2 / CGMCC 5302) TaxID=933388 RepID=S7ZLT3_PENO1|nr:hypothetical protein PDE_04601 [Penicillium oxalicum 114-2]
MPLHFSSPVQATRECVINRLKHQPWRAPILNGSNGSTVQEDLPNTYQSVCRRIATHFCKSTHIRCTHYKVTAIKSFAHVKEEEEEEEERKKEKKMFTTVECKTPWIYNVHVLLVQSDRIRGTSTTRYAGFFCVAIRTWALNARGQRDF